jgi:hypothetical protein
MWASCSRDCYVDSRSHVLWRREWDTLTNENRILKEKSQSELLRELHEKFYDQPGIVDAKRLQKDTG